MREIPDNATSCNTTQQVAQHVMQCVAQHVMQHVVQYTMQHVVQYLMQHVAQHITPHVAQHVWILHNEGKPDYATLRNISLYCLNLAQGLRNIMQHVVILHSERKTLITQHCATS